MSVGTICSRIVATASPDETVEEGALRMKEYGVGTLVVVNASRQPHGIITDRDIMVRCVAEARDPADTPVSDIMSSPVRTLHEASPLDEGLQAMQRVKARRLVITDDDGVLAGILSIDDVVSVLAEQVDRIGAVLEAQGREVLKGV